MPETTGPSGWRAFGLLQLQRVVTKMEQLGFKPTRKNIGTKPLHKTDVSAMMNKLAALLATSGKSWAYADGMARHMFGKEQVNQLDAMSLRKLIAALNIHILKEQAKQAATL
ncbi:phage protein GemA/Gp16 family protein [Kingella kingae]|uniref:phage protein GemA/Gp16 family protein n=3 Tax=Kingella kingae TaxID=504 RepID=UPI00040E342F|nr:phage protein GemA/Gp16 family protein [Kingella kingae]